MFGLFFSLAVWFNVCFYNITKQNQDRFNPYHGPSQPKTASDLPSPLGRKRFRRVTNSQPKKSAAIWRLSEALLGGK